MARTPSLMDMLNTSLRIPMVDADWAKDRGKLTGSINASFCEAITDARTLFQLPEMIREKLEEDMDAFGKEWVRDYVIHLLMLRYQALMLGEVEPGQGWGAPAPKKKK